jgi:hypothetical protein
MKHIGNSVILVGLLLLSMDCEPVHSEWLIDLVDNSENTADMGTSITVNTDGIPLILYNGYFKMKRASKTGGQWDSEIIDPVYSGYPSLVSSDDGIHMAYFDGTSTGKLIYRGPEGFPTGAVDTEFDTGRWTSMVLDTAGNPCIAYLDNANSDLKYAKYNGSNWEIETVDSAGHTGLYACLALDMDDNPYIAYSVSDAGGLRIARWNGTRWIILPVKETGATHPSIVVGVLGLHLTYYDAINEDLYYSGPPGYPSGPIDSEGNTGKWSCIVLDQFGWPHISYYNCDASALMYTYYDSEEWHTETVDTEGDVGFWSSMVLDENDHAHISYRDAAALSVKYGFNVTGPGPRPSPTPTPVKPTATPSPTAVWYELSMEDYLLEPGELFALDRHCGNPHPDPLAVDEYILLEITGRFWFWPSWVERLDSEAWDLSAFTAYKDRILEFEWPENTGSYSGVRFWGAIMHQGTYDDLISYVMIEWGYRDD